MRELTCHVTTFVSACPTCFRTHFAFLHSRMLVTFHRTCITHFSAHITHLFYIFTTAGHTLSTHCTHGHTITHHHHTACHLTYILGVIHTCGTTRFTSFHTVATGIYACLVFLIFQYTGIVLHNLQLLVLYLKVTKIYAIYTNYMQFLIIYSLECSYL